MLKKDIDGDIKTAMLAGNKRLVEVLRSIKSAVLYKEVADGKRDEGLDDDDIVKVLKKERKSRMDAQELYAKANEKERAQEEEYQISVIEGYLPEELSEEKVLALVESVISDLNLENLDMKDMGKIIGTAKQKEPNADGAMLSKIVKDLIVKGNK